MREKKSTLVTINKIDSNFTCGKDKSMNIRNFKCRIVVTGAVDGQGPIQRHPTKVGIIEVIGRLLREKERTEEWLGDKVVAILMV